MDRSPDLKVPSAPFFRHVDLPEQQMSLLRSVEGHIGLLRSGADAFVAAICLFEASAQNSQMGQLYNEWMFVAARDGAMSLNNMAMGLHYARKNIGAVREVADMVDFTILSSAERRFRELFPNAEKIRHSVAHQEYYSNPRKDTQAKSDIDLPGLFMSGGNSVSTSLVDDAFVATWEGETIQYRLNKQSALNAIEVCSLFFEGVRGLSR